MTRLLPFRRPPPGPSLALYQAAVDQARRPAFYRDLALADTVDGRFDMIALHVFLLIERLSTAGLADLAQGLFDDFFADMDENLREMGAGDLGVGKRIKKMAAAFMGRQQAYREALTETGDAKLIEALRRNVYRGAEVTEDRVAALARYVVGQRAHLAGLSLEKLQRGEVSFAALP